METENGTTRPGLKSRLKNLEIRLIGNKINLLGNTLMVGGFLSSSIIGPAAAIPILAGYFLDTSTLFGKVTVRNYEQTIKRIERGSKITPEYIEKLTGMLKDGRLCGYCDVQGIYLAAREKGGQHLEDFYNAKKQATKNIIPNF